MGEFYFGVLFDFDIVFLLLDFVLFVLLFDGFVVIDVCVLMCIDGELLCVDGVGVNWCELYVWLFEVVVKIVIVVELMCVDVFIGGL